MVRNRETLALITWEPYMHNPKLKHRLHRVRAPALFVRGASDGLVSAQYLAGYAALLPHARIVPSRKPDTRRRSSSRRSSPTQGPANFLNHCERPRSHEQ